MARYETGRTTGKHLDGDFHSNEGVGGMGGANKISSTTNLLSTLRPVTDEQSCSREEAARVERIDWQLEGTVGGQLSVIQPCESWGTPVHLCIGLDDPFNRGQCSIV